MDLTAPVEDSSLPEDEPLVTRKKLKRPTKKQSIDFCSKLLDYMLYTFFLVFLVAMILLCYYFGPGAPASTLLTLGLNELSDPSFQPQSHDIHWIDDYHYITVNESGIFKATISVNPPYSVHTEYLVKKSPDFSLGSTISWSFDGSLLLVPINVTMRWRHSFFANYLIWNVANNSYSLLANSSSSVILNAQWSKKELAIAFVMNNNIYYTEYPFDTYWPVTTDTGASIENGIMSWVYEEEVFSDYNAIWWGPSDDGFLYMKSDSTNVNTFSYPIYGTPKPPYNYLMNIKYPQAGTMNPVVSLWYYNTITNVTTPISISGNDEYITDLYWSYSDLILLRTVDRNQSVETVHIYHSVETPEVASFVSESVFKNNISQKGWIESRPYSIIFNSSHDFWMIKNNSQYFHIYHVDISNPSQPIFKNITSGTFDVLELVGYNPGKNILYFTSTEAYGDPTQCHIYKIELNQEELSRDSLTFDDIAYYSASFSPNAEFFVLNYLGPDIPTITLCNVIPDDINEKRFTSILTIEDNSELERKLSNFALPTKQFSTVAAADGTTRLFMSYMLPPVLNPGVYFPAIFDIYGGPGSQTVTREWSFGFDELLASNNIIVASVDPRGTGKRGLDFMYQVYGILGQKETEDVIAVANQFANNPYIDYGRIGIWGWSYGGYMALNTICRGGSSIFKMAISVAPVTDWLFYDTFYTERYMNQPQHNTQGYNAGSVVQNAAKLKNFPFLLVHGTGDDNVHFQNTAILNEKLVELGIQYETMFYTNRQHSISGNGARPHLYTLLYNYIVRSLVSLPEVRQQIVNN